MSRKLTPLLASLCALATLAPAATAHVNEQSQITPADLGAGDRFGQSISLSEKTVAIGAPLHDLGTTNGGAVYVYRRNGPTWSEEAKILPLDLGANDTFGSSVFLHHDTLVIGSPRDDDLGSNAGAVYVFERVGTVWSQQAKLTAPDGAAGDRFGNVVAYSEDTVVVGSPLDDDFGASSGSGHVFTRTGSVWSHESKLIASDGAADDRFGAAVAISHDMAILGAPRDDDKGFNSGSAYVFERTGTDWNEELKLRPNDNTPRGSFGAAVALTELTGHGVDNDPIRVVIGAPADDKSGQDSGSVYMFQHDAGVWTFQGQITASTTLAGDRFGGAISLDTETVLIGARLDDEAAPNGGMAYAYAVEEGAPPEEEILEASDSDPGDQAGVAVSMDVCWGAVGAYRADGAAGVDTGTAYLFVLRHHTDVYCTSGTSASGCQAQIATNGYPSASEVAGFKLRATTVEGQQNGFFFFGANGRQAVPFGNGTSYQCVAPPTTSMSLLAGNGTAGQCNGSFIDDLNTFLFNNPGSNPGPGATVQAQFWYDDPLSTSNQTTSLTNAVEFELCP